MSPKRPTPPPAWTEAELARLAALHDQGLDPPELARLLGRSARACALKLYSLGRGLRRRRWGPADDARLLRLRRAGVPLREMAQLFGLGRSTMARRLADLGETGRDPANLHRRLRDQHLTRRLSRRQADQVAPGIAHLRPKPRPAAIEAAWIDPMIEEEAVEADPFDRFNLAPRPPRLAGPPATVPGKQPEGCRWIEGDVGRLGSGAWFYCQLPVTGRGPYCAAHASRARFTRQEDGG